MSKNKRHGHTAGYKRSSEYRIWASMKTRCLNPNYIEFHLYGGRGITVCERWLVFENFLADMGPKPSDGHSLDRVDPNGNYEPSNCRWATATEQANNTRGNRLIEIDGETKTLAQWAKETGTSASLVINRCKLGWPLERAVLTPPRKHRPRQKR